MKACSLGSYRTIFLSGILPKLVCLVLLERLECISEGALPDSQCGFRPMRSAAHMISCIRSVQQHAGDANYAVVAAFVDFRRAFDSPPKQLILDRLKHLGAPENLLSMVERLNGTVTGVVQGDPTARFHTHRGVKQASKLKIYIRELNR